MLAQKKRQGKGWRFMLKHQPFCWLRKPPALPVEVSRKKALASSIERSEPLTESFQ